MAKSDVADFVCRPFCSFYREGVKEELICNGARILEILNNNGNLSHWELKEVRGVSSLSQEEFHQLEESVCRPCPFFIDGCDFRSDPPPLNAEPCGGFIALVLLLGNGSIRMEILEEAAVG
jgi:hypothetical protein